MERNNTKDTQQSTRNKDQSKNKKKKTANGKSLNSIMKEKYFDYYSDIKSSARDNGEW